MKLEHLSFTQEGDEKKLAVDTIATYTFDGSILEFTQSERFREVTEAITLYMAEHKIRVDEIIRIVPVQEDRIMIDYGSYLNYFVIVRKSIDSLINI